MTAALPQGVYRFLDLSTGHLTRKDISILTAWAAVESHPYKVAPYRTIEHSYGFFVHVRLDGPEDRAEYEREALLEGISPCFFAAQEYARQHQCWWLNFDADADFIDALEPLTINESQSPKG